MTDITSPGDELTSLSDRDLLLLLADKVENLTALVHARLELAFKKLDHLDGLAHETDQHVRDITALLDQHKPLLDRAAGMLDPGARVREFLTGKGKAKT